MRPLCLLLLAAAPAGASMVFSASFTVRNEASNEIVESCSLSDSSPVQCGYAPGDFGAFGETGWLYAGAEAAALYETGYMYTGTASFAGSLTITGRTGSGVVVPHALVVSGYYSHAQFNPPPNEIPCPSGFANPDGWPCYSFDYGTPITVSGYVRSGGVDEAIGNRASVVLSGVDVLDGTGHILGSFLYTSGYVSDVLSVPPLHAPEPSYGMVTVCVGLVYLVASALSRYRQR
jgi:hypothetical protein